MFRTAIKSLDELVRDVPHISIKVPVSYTKALRDDNEKPIIIKQAEGLKNTLENLPILIRPDEIIVGTFDEEIPVAIPRLEASGYRIMNELETLHKRKVNPIKVKENDIKILREKIAPFYENLNIRDFAQQSAPEYFFACFSQRVAYMPPRMIFVLGNRFFKSCTTSKTPRYQ